MNVYLYDSYVSQKKYESKTAKIETRLTDLGLNGKIIRLGLMSSIIDSIENEVKRGAKTITAVGNTNLLNQTITTIARLKAADIISQKVLVGFIPIGKKNNSLASYLGIDLEEGAPDILSARRVETLDLGLVNENYFLTQATISTVGTTIEIDKNYSIEFLEKGEVGIINLPAFQDLPPEVKSNARDGTLELYIQTTDTKKYLPIPNSKINQSIISFTQLQIINSSESVLLDNTVETKTPASVKIAAEKIDLIVGKSRKF